MRLRILLPKVKPEAISVPTQCVYAGCGGRKFHLRQEVRKPLRDTVYQEVQVPRYQCLKCKRTFRVYPEGTTRAQTSQRVKGLAVMLYLLGLSYGAVSLALDGLGISLCKSRVYDAVQEASKRVPGLKRDQVFAGVKTPALGADLTSVPANVSTLIEAIPARTSGYHPSRLKAVEASASLRTTSGCRMAVCSATPPPREKPNMSACSNPRCLIKAAMSSAINSKRSGRSMSAVCPCPCSSTPMTRRAAASCGTSSPIASMVMKPPGSSTSGCPLPCIS